jgi:hypothetical protein
VVLLLFAASAFSCGLAACGEAGNEQVTAPRAKLGVAARSGTSGRARTGAPGGYRNDGDGDPSNDGDGDDLGGNSVDTDHDDGEDHLDPRNNSYHDKDDAGVVAYGRPATEVERAAVVATVQHYYAAAAAEQGQVACSMISPSLAKAVPEDYGSAPGPAYLRGGKTCQGVMVRLFKHMHTGLGAKIHVTAVRVKGNYGLALLGSTKAPASELPMDRDGAHWWIGSLLAGELP